MIIIGGGIAGLYSAFLIQKLNPSIKLLILEKESKREIGGRIGSYSFYGSQLATGAGVGRKKKDLLLINLLKELKIKTSSFTPVTEYADTIIPPCNVHKYFLLIKKEYIKEKKKKDKERKRIQKTFKEFAEPILGYELYKNFIICAGYTDYENEDIHDMLYHYGFDDNYTDFDAIGIPWSLLVKSLVAKIGSNNIKGKSTVTSIQDSSSCQYQIKTKEGDTYLADKVIVATTVDTVMKLLGSQFPIYNQIHGQSFLRIYGKFTKASANIMDSAIQSSVLVVPGPIHKIIPMNKETGVYMIAYTDNAGAHYLKRYINNTEANRKALCHLLEKAMGITKNILELREIVSFYWPIGTHYYEPLSGPYYSREDFIKHAQNPNPNLFVVGEMVSNNQGWVEGALESVDKLFTFNLF